MSVFSSSFLSTAGTLVSKVAPRQVLSFLYPLEFRRNFNSDRRLEHYRSPPLPMFSTTTPELEAWFIKSLASASHCHKHQPKIFQPSTLFSSQRPDASISHKHRHNVTFRRQKSTVESEYDKQAELPVENHTREELLELVDGYTGESFTDQLPLLEIPNLYQPSDGPHLTVSDKIEDEWPPPHYAWPADPQTKSKLKRFEELVDDFSADSDEIYEVYQTLPRPRAPYLEAKLRHKFLRHLSTIERKDEHSMLRYLSVVEDMKVSAIPLTLAEWNSAMSFVSRYVTKSTEIEVEAALHMWRDMEHTAGIVGNGVTFNILFDVACKAGKFVLAEMIYKEMEARGFEFDRYHHVSLIHYYGLRREGDGARAAYKELVEAGEIVDTIVLNAMISALISSYEPGAAEMVYERMKRIHLQQPEPKFAPNDYIKQKQITRTLQRMAKRVKLDPSVRGKFQARSIIAPDLQTYRILIGYFAVKSGELDKSATLLREMQWFNIPIHGSLFLALLKGFAIHGGIRYTHWTEERLESVWKSFLEAIDNEAPGLYISRWIVIWALRAFGKTSGKAKTLAVWEEIREKWQPDEMDLDFVMGFLNQVLEGVDMGRKRNDWLLGSL